MSEAMARLQRWHGVRGKPKGKSHLALAWGSVGSHVAAPGWAGQVTRLAHVASLTCVLTREGSGARSLTRGDLGAIRARDQAPTAALYVKTLKFDLEDLSDFWKFRFSGP